LTNFGEDYCHQFIFCMSSPNGCDFKSRGLVGSSEHSVVFAYSMLYC
jgi:hypothetical protein